MGRAGGVEIRELVVVETEVKDRIMANLQPLQPRLDVRALVRAMMFRGRMRIVALKVGHSSRSFGGAEIG